MNNKHLIELEYACQKARKNVQAAQAELHSAALLAGKLLESDGSNREKVEDLADRLAVPAGLAGKLLESMDEVLDGDSLRFGE